MATENSPEATPSQPLAGHAMVPLPWTNCETRAGVVLELCSLEAKVLKTAARFSVKIQWVSSGKLLDTYLLLASFPNGCSVDCPLGDWASATYMESDHR